MGGVQQYLSNAVLNMVRCRSVVVTRQVGGQRSDGLADDYSPGGRVYRISDWPSCSSTTVVYKSPGALLKLCRRVYGIIRKEDISLVVVGQINFALLLLVFFLKKTTRLPVALIFHGEDIPAIPLKSNKIRRSLINNADLFVSNSGFTKDALLQFVGDLRPSFVSCPGVEDKFFDDVDISVLRDRYDIGHRHVIYTVGRLDLRKGHDLVIEVLPAVIEKIPDVIYLIGGVGQNVQPLKQKVSKMGLDNHVLFCGYIPDDEIVAFHQLGDVFVMPNRTLDDGDTEGFGIVFLEANACSKPVIGGACGGVFDAIEQGVNGFLVNPSDAGELCEKIISLLSDPSLAAAMGASGRQRAWQKFRWPVLATQLEDLFFSTVQSSLRGKSA